MNIRPMRFAALVLLLAPLLLSTSTLAHADTIVVAISAGNPTLGVSVVSDDAQCSLREAMLLANGAPVNDDCTSVNDGNATLTISLPSASFVLTDGPYVADGSNGLPDVTGTYAITGPATILRSTANGTPRFRLLHVAASGDLTINNIDFLYGHASDGEAGPGDAGASGGGIYNAGTLTINDSSVTGSTSGAGVDGAGGDGGGICNVGTLDLANTIVSDNKAGAGGNTHSPIGFLEVHGGNGGGIYNSGSLEITGGSINANTTGAGGNSDQGPGSFGGAGGDGGGIYNSDSGSLEITGGTLSANVTGAGGNHVGIVGNGGGVAGRGTVIIVASTIVGNVASDGFGIYGGGGNWMIANTTIAGNSGSAAGGEAILTQGTAQLTLSYVTVAAPSAGALQADSGASVITVDHSIVDAPGGAACVAGAGHVGSNGYNLASDTSCGFGGAGDENGVLPMLAAAPADNGGPTWTLLPQPDSPAIDAIPVADCALGVPAGVEVSVDQRGAARPSGFGCDIGAVELTATTLLPTSGSGQAAPLWSPFLNPLVVKVRDAGGNVIQGMRLRVRPPAAGEAGAICADAISDSAGDALLYCRANGVAGGLYKLAVDTVGGIGAPAVFKLINDASDIIFIDGFDPPGPLTMILPVGATTTDVALALPPSLPRGVVVPLRAVSDAQHHRVALVEARRDAGVVWLRVIRYAARGRSANVGAWQPLASLRPTLHIERHAGRVSANLHRDTLVSR